MNRSRSKILIFFSKSIALSSIMCFFFATTSNSHLYVSIAYTFVAYYIFTSIFSDGCFFASTTFSSLASLCIIYASTKCCSITSFSFDSLMNIGSINVAPSHVCSITCQRPLLLHKNSTSNVPSLYISWIIIWANYILLLYAFPSAHFKDDDECGGNFTTNGWIFNTFFLYSL
jgi:hypothetical protein